MKNFKTKEKEYEMEREEKIRYSLEIIRSLYEIDKKTFFHDSTFEKGGVIPWIG